MATRRRELLIIEGATYLEVLIMGLTSSSAVVRSNTYISQVIDFSGLREPTNKRLGTDIDYFAEYDDLVYIIGEFKHGGANLPTGQALGFTRLVRALDAAGKVAVLLHLAHWTPAPQPVDAASAQVLAGFFRGPGDSAPRWHRALKSDMHLSDAIIFFTREAGITPPVQYLGTA